MINHLADLGFSDPCHAVNKQNLCIFIIYLFCDPLYYVISADKIFRNAVLDFLLVNLNCGDISRTGITADPHILSQLVYQGINRFMLTVRIPNDLKVHFIEMLVFFIKISFIIRHFNKRESGCANAVFEYRTGSVFI